MLIQLINLDRSPERLQQFTAVNGHLTNVERFPAIDGGRQDIAALTRNRQSRLGADPAGHVGKGDRGR